VELFEIGAAVGRLGAFEDIGSALKQLRLPLADLIWVDVELLGEVRYGLVAFDGSDGHLGFEGRRLVAA